MAAQAMKKKRLGLFATVSLVVLLLTALHLMSLAIQQADTQGEWFIPLLLFTVAGLVVLVGLIGWNSWQLLRDFRRKAAGSRLTARLTVLFVVLALLPVSVVYFYSLQFLSRGIDSWFDVEVDRAMEDALTLSKVSLDQHKKELLKLTENALSTLEDSSSTALALSVNDLRDATAASEMALFDQQGKMLAMSNIDPDVLTPTRPDSGIVQQLMDGRNYVGLAPLKDDKLMVRCLVRDPLQRGLVLQAMYPVAESLSILSRSVQDAYEAYRGRAYLRTSIKFSFALTLSLVMLLGVFAAAWVAFYTARRLVTPITEIAEGTRAVAEGNYDQRLPVPRYKDEVSFLVSSFNTMTQRIARARNAAEESRRELQVQHAYLETVLGGLSSGVMAMDAQGNVQTFNSAANQILGVDLALWVGQPLSRLSQQNETLWPFIDRVTEGLKPDTREVSAEITLYRGEGRQVLLCRHSPLRFVEEERAGHVLVFDDVTELVRAQRDAAWGEVARRLAHEIKNPLTPIQLSAERLRRKYLKLFNAEDGRVLDRATTTIVQQVEAMKSMVNDFSDYAKPSRMQPEPIRLDDFLAEILALYEGHQSNVRFLPGARGIRIEADPVRMRQVVHNLIKNGIEALVDTQSKVTVSTRIGEQEDCEFVEIFVNDEGPGFVPEMLGRVFEPYVTSKARGTGLGLAIVKRIVAEHAGVIRAENLPEGGGSVVIRLPVLTHAPLDSSAENLDEGVKL